MKVIFQGENVTINESIGLADSVRLYNLATKYYVEATRTSLDGDVELTPEDTAAMPVGVYNLEIFTKLNSMTRMVKCIENYAVVKESSLAQK